MQEIRNRILPGQEKLYTIMCIGESTTAIAEDPGMKFWLTDKFSYPRQLEEILNKDSDKIRFKVINKGIVNCDSYEILRVLKDNLNLYNPNMVIAMMGIRDSASTPLYEETALASLNEKSFLGRSKVYRLVELLLENISSDSDPYIQAQAKQRPIPLARFYEIRRDFKKAEGLYKKEIKINPANPEGYIKLALLYGKQEKHDKAKAFIKKAKELPCNKNAYSLLGDWYKFIGEYNEAEKMFKKAISENKFGNMREYLELGKLYSKTEHYKEAEQAFKNALDGEIANQKYERKLLEQVYLELGYLYKKTGNYQQAEKMLKEGIARFGVKNLIYNELARLYRKQGRHKDEEELYQKATIKLRRYGEYLDLLNYYRNQERYRKEEEVLKIAMKVIPSIAHNYHKLQEILSEEGIILVAMQYPGYNVNYLSYILSNKNDSIFIDNENIFNTEPYDNYYYEASEYLFPHYTKRGAEILAGNVANVLSKEYFNKLKKKYSH